MPVVFWDYPCASSAQAAPVSATCWLEHDQRQILAQASLDGYIRFFGDEGQPLDANFPPKMLNDPQQRSVNALTMSWSGKYLAVGWENGLY